MLFDGIILTCKSHLKEERSVAAIYYLLKGEKSIQTVQDAHIYKLKQFYGVYKTLNKSDFDIRINNLLQQDLLTVTKSNTIVYQSTNKAKEWLKKNNSNLPLNYFNGLQYDGISNVFLDRLLFLIQVLTNSKMRNYSYIPIIDQQTVANWVKFAYQKMRPNINQQLHTLFEELYSLLREFPEREAEIFVDRITSYRTYGLSMDQLAIKYEQDVADLRLLLVGISHRMLDHINRDISSYPLLSFITRDLNVKSDNKLTHSATITNDLIKKKHSINEVAHIRQLKVNTIYDHIVEIALYDQEFPIHKYVSEKNKQKIISVIRQINSFTLKDIKNKVNKEISYFQIRLVLATINNKSKLGD